MKHTFIYLLIFFAFTGLFSACQEERVQPHDPVAQAEADDKLIREYIAKDTSVHNPVRTPSGLFYNKRIAGNGTKVKTGDLVVVHYIGKYLNGQVFESSYSTNSPFSFKVGITGVIAGWKEGILLMEEGETARFYIPSGLAYGPGGSRGGIPANASLVFDITLLDVNP